MTPKRKKRPETAVQDVAAGALAYDTIGSPVERRSRLKPLLLARVSVDDHGKKGAMIFHMLRWEMGDKAFLDSTQRRAQASTPAKRFAHRSSRKLPRPIAASR